MTEALEGNPLQRNILTVMLFIAIVVLFQRRREFFSLLRVNAPILLFFGYCAVSTLWSDFTDVSFKRWIKALGDPLMVMIVLTDPVPSHAVKRFLAWTGFLLVPVSVLLIRYYPLMGRAYRNIDGKIMFTGVASDKNMLGAISLLFGLGAVWRILHWLQERHPRSIRSLMVYGSVVLMVLWLLRKANSATSLACFVLASVVLVVTSIPVLARCRAIVHLVVVMVLAVSTIALFFDAGGGMVQTLGRDATLTGRTDLWDEIIPMNGDPFLGTGFESFWMGSRLEKIWSLHWWHPNEAHNGYIEVFLNLGWTGLSLLAIVAVTGYRNALNKLRWDPELGGISVAFFVVGMTYSCTEAGFRMLNPVWICFLLAAIAVPKSRLLQTSAATDSRETAATPVPQLAEALSYPRSTTYMDTSQLRYVWSIDPRTSHKTEL
ncbi:MAG: O-antigen ligase family protein [Acidobacteriia bacterium]|nr:O-antigen ligase family protein [Terriglobia bacterium]